MSKKFYRILYQLLTPADATKLAFNPISPDVGEGRHPLSEVLFLALFNKAIFALCRRLTGIHIRDGNDIETKVK